MKNKLFRTALSLGLAVSLAAAGPGISAAAEETETVAEVTEDTADEGVKETFVIENADDFLEFAQNCRVDSWSRNRVIELKADIDLGGREAENIASFSGTFHGNGYTISGVTVQGTGSALGLFCYLEKGGVIEDLNVSGRYISEIEADVVGAIAGVNAGTISKCSFDGIIRAEGTAGGIAGVNGASGVISFCRSAGTIVSSRTVGGITGENRGTITLCQNTADINADTSWVDEETDSSDFTSNLTGTVEEMLESGCDIGGISGFSSGAIRNCTNSGTVGYLHTGKNVGGIAGRQSGQILSCRNMGFVYGKQDVGGIVGQDEPFIKEEEVKKLKDEIGTLRTDLETLSGDLSTTADRLDADAETLGNLMDRASVLAGDSLTEAEQTIQETSDAGNKLIGYVSEASGYLQDSIAVMQAFLGEVDLTELQTDISDIELPDTDISDTELPDTNTDSADIDLADPETLDSTAVMEKLQTALKQAQDGLAKMADVLAEMDQTEIPDVSSELIGYTEELKNVFAQINSASGTLRADAASGADLITADLDLVNNQAADIADMVSDRLDALENAADGLEAITDESETDSDNELASRIKSCRNSGTVYGDTAAAGVAGNASRETSTTETLSLGKLYDAWLVIENCENTGIVHVKNRYAGGIVGYSEMGVIRSCTGQGYIYADSGSYLGGIMGYGSAEISDCKAAAVLDGSSDIGGIAGSAEKISGCLSLVWIDSDEDRIGAILGEDAGEDEEDVTVGRLSMALRFQNNYFCSDTLSGINGVSYEGSAEPVSRQELAEKESGTAVFDRVTVTYIDEDDVIISTENPDYGTEASALDYPEVEADAGCYVVWEGNLEDRLTCNTVLRAVQKSEVKVLGTLPNAAGQGRILIAGEFTTKASAKGEVLADYTVPQIIPEKAEVNAYRVTLTDSGLNDTDTSEMRIYVGEHDQVYVYTKQGSRWKKVNAEVIGQYAEVTLTGTEGEFLTAVWDKSILPAVIAAGAGLLILAAVIVILSVRHKKKKEKIKGRKEAVEK